MLDIPNGHYQAELADGVYLHFNEDMELTWIEIHHPTDELLELHGITRGGGEPKLPSSP